MYEQSQALAAHEQQQREGEGSRLAADGLQQHQPLVTPNDLTSALSAALGPAQPHPQPPPPTATPPSSTTPQSGAGISQDTLSSALAGVYRGSLGAPPPAQMQGTHPQGPTPSSLVSQSLRDQYRQQVVLHA